MIINALLAAMSATDSRIIAASVLMIAVALLAVALTVVILMQRGSGDNVSAITGGNQESFFAKSKGGRTARLLRILTIAFSSALVVLAIVFFVVAPL